MDAETEFRRLRLAAGLSQNQLADRTGIAVKNIQQYDSGEVRVGTKNAARLAPHLGVSPAQLLGLEPVASVEPRGPVESPRDRQVRRWGEWVVSLPEDVRTIVYRVGVGLTSAAAGQRLSALPRSPETQDQDTATGDGTPRRPPAEAAGAGPRKRAKQGRR